MSQAVWVPYCGTAPDPAEWLGRWNLDPMVIGPLLALLVWGLWRAPAERQGAVIAAVALAALVFVSPLCALSSALFSARTAHHVLLVAVLAPMISPLIPWRLRGGLLVATLGQAVVFWAWHAPGAYGWALSSDLGYWLMQVSLLASAIWFWRVLRSADDLSAVAALLVAMVLMGLLGAILVFAPAPLYAPHWISAEVWGLGALRDQQLAGLMMWAPAAGLYLAAALQRLGRRLIPRAAPA